jgi:hypothetical protein
MAQASSSSGTPFDEVLAEEGKYTAAWRRKTGRGPDAPLSGLALSGGGIRSAVFCLGVLQALAKQDLLKRFDYLSTVSGGGYIGASLTWLTSRPAKPFGVGPDDFPYGTDNPAADPSPRLGYLRRHGSYLAPGGGMQALPGIAIVLRGLVLNLLLLWLPLATVVLIILRGIYGGLSYLASDVAYGRLEPWMFPAAVAVAFIALALRYSLYAGFKALVDADTPYSFRQDFEEVAPGVLKALAVLGVLASLPYVHAMVGDEIRKEGLAGAAMTLGGAAMGLWARFVPKGDAAGTAMAWLGPIGAALVLYGVALMAYALSVHAFPHDRLIAKLIAADPWRLVCAGLVLAFCLVVGYMTDLNEITLHRFYRDRLMEAFMPDDTFVQSGQAQDGQKANDADAARLGDMCRPANPDGTNAANGPYHLVNTHLVLTKIDVGQFPQPAAFPMSQEQRGFFGPWLQMQKFPLLRDFAADWSNKCRIRGGDNFVLSPRYCGSAATGWYATATPAFKDLSLPTAMAASGAAVNPDAANAGVGPQRNMLFATLMSLLNIRLGYWLRNPKRETGRARSPNHFSPGVTGTLDQLALDSRFLQIADGGDFENLGVYELLRRGAGTIVVCDGTADPVPAFADLQNLITRAEADFGVTIRFTSPPLGVLMPAKPAAPQFPSKVRFAKEPFVVGDIVYASGAIGRLYYIKPAIFDALPFSLLGFKGASPQFPNDSTANQFFDEARFEAYRELGWACAHRMLANKDIWNALSAM